MNFWISSNELILNFFRKRLLEMQPRRQSSRIEKLKNQKEIQKKQEEEQIQHELMYRKDEKEKFEQERKER